MSLKDLLPPGTWEELNADSQPPAQTLNAAAAPDLASVQEQHQASGSDLPQGLLVRCPVCSVLCRYDISNPFRPFCSEKCRLLDLYAWTAEERTIPGENTAAASEA